MAAYSLPTLSFLGEDVGVIEAAENFNPFVGI
jgi:hypothetical protein